MNEDFYINLIYKKLTDELSAEEKVLLDTWLKTSEENRLTAKQVEQAWRASDLLAPEIEVDLDLEFNALEALMEEESEAIIKQIETKPKIIRRWLAIAASFLILVSAGLGVLLYWPDKGPISETTIATVDVARRVILPDNSIVYLNKFSQLTYPERFSKKQRIVSLKGEAFFEVEHNPSNPFIVKTKQEEIKVLGTSFNVLTTDSEETVVYVASGKVELRQSDEKAIILEKNERGISNIAQDVLINEGQTIENDLAWRTRILIFRDAPLKKVFEVVEKNYEVQFSYENGAFQDCTFTGSFEDNSLEEVLETISLVMGISFEEKEEQMFIINGESGC